LDETSQPVELLLSVSRDGPETLVSQIEDQLRVAIRDGSLRAGAQVPSTRDLARQLGVSRRVIVDAYGQLAAEGYLVMRQGARPQVSEAGAATAPSEASQATPARPPRYDFRPSVPDVSDFPRSSWLRSLRQALGTIADLDLGYGDPLGVEELRIALSDYLGRVRGVVAEPGRLIVTSGYTQGLALVAHALATSGAKRIAIEDPSNPEQTDIVARAGLETVAVGVDHEGLRVSELGDADAVVVTPAHQHPTGVVLSGERRNALLGWLREREAIAIEDDYDAEYRYDRAAVGALQGLDPERVVYAGSSSKTLAPALRIGWLVAPPGLVDAIRTEKLLADRGTARIEQLALADFLTRGDLDRYLRRMRVRYRARRDALVAAIEEELPEAKIRGVAAGLHATVELPAGADERAIQAEAERRRVLLAVMSEARIGDTPLPPALLLGYAHTPEPSIAPGVREIAAAVRACDS
jgi:GntR family transcriptional regulator / MocR family aminotransferase